MGLSLSSLKIGPKDPPKTVLVPPLFERDIKDRDRFAYSSYPYLFGKRQIKFLLDDYLTTGGGVQGVVLFSPPADDQLSVEARVGPASTSMALRYQPLGVAQPGTFLDVAANPKKAGDVTLRASFLDPVSGFGAFMTAPLAKRISGTLAQVGVRYSSPALTAGAIAEPRTGNLSALWLAARHQSLVAGLEVRPRGTAPPPPSATSDPDALAEWLRTHTRVALAYEPTFVNEAGQGRFSACVEMEEGHTLSVTFFQHLALSRRVLNPMESGNVVGITNYVDLGMQILMPTAAPDAPASAAPGTAPATTTSSSSSTASASASASKAGEPSSTEGSVNLAAAWQLNKNWLLKARVGTESASLGIAAKKWGRLGMVGAACASYTYGDKGVRWGAWVQFENFGPLRYERGVSALSGRAVLQRHEASAIDLANAEGDTKRVVAVGAPETQYNTQSVDITREYL